MQLPATVSNIKFLQVDALVCLMWTVFVIPSIDTKQIAIFASDCIQLSDILSFPNCTFCIYNLYNTNLPETLLKFESSEIIKCTKTKRKIKCVPFVVQCARNRFIQVFSLIFVCAYTIKSENWIKKINNHRNVGVLFRCRINENCQYKFRTHIQLLDIFPIINAILWMIWFASCWFTWP